MATKARAKVMRLFSWCLWALAGALLVSVLTALAVIGTGRMPVGADHTPSAMETAIFGFALRASVARQSANQPDSGDATKEELTDGAEIYKSLCAQCHGSLGGRKSILGASFYPPAPQLPGRGTAYSDREVFWLVKHGIRNTAMPSWGKLLSDDDIRKVTAVVMRLKASPDGMTDSSGGGGVGGDYSNPLLHPGP